MLVHLNIISLKIVITYNFEKHLVKNGTSISKTKLHSLLQTSPETASFHSIKTMITFSITEIFFLVTVT